MGNQVAKTIDNHPTKVNRNGRTVHHNVHGMDLLVKEIKQVTGCGNSTKSTKKKPSYTVLRPRHRPSTSGRPSRNPSVDAVVHKKRRAAKIRRDETVQVVPRQQRRQPRVTFHETVKIRHIPNRRDYSREERRAMWRSAYQIHVMSQRNKLEREHEGKDWRHVFEEQDMFIDTRRGKLIHPLWVDVNHGDELGDDVLRLRNQSGFYNEYAYGFCNKFSGGI